MSQTTAPTAAAPDPVAAVPTTGRRRTRRLWDVAPADAAAASATASVQKIENPLVQNLITGPDRTVTAEYVINDCRHRGLLTRKTVHVQLQNATKTTAVVRGRYLVDSKLSTPTDRSLHLTLTSPSMDDMVEAVKWIDRVVETGSTYNGPAAAAPDAAAPLSQPTAVKDADGNLTLSVPVTISRAAAEARKFPLVASLLGPDNAYVKHIETQSGSQIELRNQNRPMAVLLSFEITAKTTTGVNDAKKLIDDLIQTVKAAFEAARSAPKSTPPNPAPVLPPAAAVPRVPARAPYPPMPPAYPPYAPMMPPMYGVPAPYHPGMAPYYYAPPPVAAYAPPYPPAMPVPPPVSNENQFPGRPEPKKTVSEPEPSAKKARTTTTAAALPDESGAEFEKFKRQMTGGSETIVRPIVTPSSSASGAISDADAQRIMKEHLDL